MSDIKDLLDIMARLRDPENGCPWDLEQDFKTIAPYTIEEAYEVADAIERNDMADLKDELGDLLFQVVFHAQMASEKSVADGGFGFQDVVQEVCDKMIRRHPHVFADGEVADAEHQTMAWEEHKAAERAAHDDQSALAGVAAGLPEWLRAAKLHKRAARVGFDWDGPHSVISKMKEELAELDKSLDGDDPDHVEEELGDLLFVSMALAQHAGVDPGRALRRANARFEHRFRGVERLAGERGIELKQSNMDTLDGLWNEIKAGS